MAQGMLKVRFTVAYFPPRPSREAAISQWKGMVTELVRWVRQEIGQTPHSLTPIVGMDANTGMGKSGRDLINDDAVGPVWACAPNEIGKALHTLMRNTSMCAINTLWPQCGHTCEGPRGSRSRIDYLMVPQSLRLMVKSCAVWSKHSRRVQASPFVRDHLPIVCAMDAPTPAQARPEHHGTR